MRFLKIFLIGGFFLALIAADIKRKVTISFEGETNEVDFYQIEWLKELPLPGQKVPLKERFIENVTSSPIRKEVPAEYRFFRMRTVVGGYAGPWGEVYSLEKATEKLTVNLEDTPSTTKPASPTVLSDKAKEEVVSPSSKPSPSIDLVKEDCCFRTVVVGDKKQTILVGQQLPLDQLVTEKPLYYSLNGSPKKPYREPLLFTSDGDYRLEVFTGEPPRQQLRRTLSFRVDTLPPVTRVGLYQPVIYDGGQLWITGNSRIELVSEDLASGIAAIYYRFYLDTKEPPEFSKYSQEFSPLPQLPDIEQGVLLEFYAIDQNGNREKTKQLIVYVDTLAPRLQLAPKAPVGYHRFLLQEKSPPVSVEFYDSQGKLVHKAQTRDMLQFPKIPAGKYRVQLSDNFGNRRQQEVEIPR